MKVDIFKLPFFFSNEGNVLVLVNKWTLKSWRVLITSQKTIGKKQKRRSNVSNAPSQTKQFKHALKQQAEFESEFKVEFAVYDTNLRL